MTPPRAFQETFGLPLGLHGCDDSDKLHLCYGPNASISYNYSVDLDSLHHNLIVDMPLELEMHWWPHLNCEIVGHNQVAKIAHTITKIPYNSAFFVTKQFTCIVIDGIIHTCAQSMGQGLLLQDVKKRSQISNATIAQHA